MKSWCSPSSPSTLSPAAPLPARFARNKLSKSKTSSLLLITSVNFKLAWRFEINRFFLKIQHISDQQLRDLKKSLDKDAKKELVSVDTIVEVFSLWVPWQELEQKALAAKKAEEEKALAEEKQRKAELARVAVQEEEGKKKMAVEVWSRSDSWIHTPLI